MRIATWNINSVRTRIERLTDWLQRTEVDVLALQETKCRDDQFPALELSALGYEVAHFGLNQWNGVAILSRVGMSENPDAARHLVERELGKLAAPDPGLDIVRETLSHYLRNGSNIVLTASELYVHRNTVRYRLDQAEQLVGHPLTERRTEMDVALRLVAAGLGH